MSIMQSNMSYGNTNNVNTTSIVINMTTTCFVSFFLRSGHDSKKSLHRSALWIHTDVIVNTIINVKSRTVKTIILGIAYVTFDFE